ncbi:MAG: LysR family transcriptional regulator [Marinomonas sp.]|uniref:LysR family transcriptional regulator n=1 Tax=unclassified Marinomonas TaxID=196814 RepID=UPI0007AF4D3A|nr:MULTISPECIES: LysR family transcriptional regulator [unclassified Marinomonas]KZM42995.1 LysR family transcriptional regulator [Marinomonas sp. SBI22]KZM44565.1 LysR family transcriptional regulator [Marinomonas sp. SBI8L]
MKHWDGIEAFVEVVRQGSFSAAAEKLHVSASHISRLVSQLEKRLDSTLLFRTTRSIRLSEAGSLYYQQCSQLLDSIDSAEEMVTSLNQSPVGHLRISCATTFGERFIAPRVNDFLLTHPKIQLDLHLTNREVDLIDEGYDLAIRLGTLKSSSLLARRLCDRVEHVCASAHYIARYGMPHTLSELSKHQCLQGSKDVWTFMQDKQKREVKINANWRSNSGPALLDATLKGLGIAQLPDYYVASYIASGELIPILSQYQYPYTGVWLVYPKARQQSPKLKLLCDHLIDSFRTGANESPITMNG